MLISTAPAIRIEFPASRASAHTRPRNRMWEGLLSRLPHDAQPYVARRAKHCPSQIQRRAGVQQPHGPRRTHLSERTRPSPPHCQVEETHWGTPSAPMGLSRAQHRPVLRGINTAAWTNTAGPCMDTMLAYVCALAPNPLTACGGCGPSALRGHRCILRQLRYATVDTPPHAAGAAA
ncbi:hypothetical protein BD413DRAFT_292765 [Trametes elegans]|nr:hypothetical protein BD413DRAFT_292765 [Trametes elegans]